jgi:biopolymer transport protein ExbD
MAVAVGGASGSGRRKSLDAEINLVSFIDLLSMCICFLLMTAVWLEVGSLQVKQSHGTEGAASTSQSHEVELTVDTPSSLQFVIKKSGRPVQKQQLKAGSVEELSLQLNQAMLLSGRQGESDFGGNDHCRFFSLLRRSHPGDGCAPEESDCESRSGSRES